jgi:hypothetical protein
MRSSGRNAADVESSKTKETASGLKISYSQINRAEADNIISHLLLKILYQASFMSTIPENFTMVRKLVHNGTAIKSIYYLFLAAAMLSDICLIHTNVVSHIVVRDGAIMNMSGDYSPMPNFVSAYFVSYSAVIFIAAVGLFFRKKWSDLLFHIFALPALIALLIDGWLYHSNREALPAIFIIAFFALLFTLILLNRNRAILIRENYFLNKKDILMISVGICLNICLFIAVMKAW